MLHEQTDRCDAAPTAKAHDDWLSAGFNQFYNICVQADGGHGKDDKELAQFFYRREDTGVHIAGYGDCGDDGSGDKIQNKHGENLFYADLFFGRTF